MRMTWTLWRGICHPFSNHPLFQLVLSQGRLPMISPRYMLILMAMMTFSCVIFPAMLTGLMLLFLLGLFAFLVGNGTFAGLAWAAVISTAIVRERERGNYDILSLAPVGQLGAQWLIATACMNRAQGVIRLNGLVRTVLIIILVTLISVAIIISMNMDPGRANRLTFQSNTQTLFNLAFGLMLIVGLYIDHIQSLVTACLIGMIAPGYLGRSVDARVAAGAAFLALQVGTYASWWCLIALLFPAVFHVLRLDSAPSIQFVHNLLGLISFYGLRECGIRRLWRTLIYNLNADNGESQQLLRTAV